LHHSLHWSWVPYQPFKFLFGLSRLVLASLITIFFQAWPFNGSKLILEGRTGNCIFYFTSIKCSCSKQCFTCPFWVCELLAAHTVNMTICVCLNVWSFTVHILLLRK
jgi:hypothetical protein